jgi:hypothetical protein
VNSTQVDQFGLPLKLTLESRKGKSETSGIDEFRNVVQSKYTTGAIAPKAPFQSTLIEWPQRILNPTYVIETYLSNTFPAGTSQQYKDQAKALSTYFDSYIDAVWNYYTNNTLTLVISKEKYTGTVVNGQFVFEGSNRQGGTGKFALTKPTSGDHTTPSLQVFAGNGVFDDVAARGLNPDTPPGSIIGALEAQLDAAFNRGVLSTAETAKFLVPTSKYPDPVYNPSYFYNDKNPSNLFAKFFHQISIGHKAYGFAYDDVGDNSSTLVSAHPKLLTVSIGWNAPRRP